VNLVGLLQIISGVILTGAVYAVRKYLVENDAQEMINTAYMALHACAFVFYLFAEVAYFATLTIRIERPESNLVLLAQYGTLFYVVLNFLS
jgi:hypothetical protein